MRTLLTVMLVTVLAGTFTAAAQANHPSASYADASLRGQTANAPDNDIRGAWDYLQNGCGYNIVSSYQAYFSAPYSSLPHYRFADYKFKRANGSYVSWRFSAWWASSTEYHDERYDPPHC